LRARREEAGGVEGGDRVEARKREELGLAVAVLDLALHGERVGVVRAGAEMSESAER
jgi:hypothetical protein